MKRKFISRKLFTLYAIILFVGVGISVKLSNSVTVAVHNSPIIGRRQIIIDAGHGGIDGGATSCTGITESQLNLQISMRLDDLFHLLGHQTTMLRKSDTSLHTEGNTIGAQKISDLRYRVNTVNQLSPALLISIHQNTFPDAKYRGAQVFYNNIGTSSDVATALQSSFVGTVNPGSNRKAKVSQGVYLMRHVNYPSVLVECGFLTNPDEEAALRTPEYQLRICCVIASTVSRHLAASE